MNRLAFRVWIEPSEYVPGPARMVTPSQLTDLSFQTMPPSETCANSVSWRYCDGVGGFTVGWTRERYTVMQSTGLMDRAGVTIFEGDIVSYVESELRAPSREDFNWDYGAFDRAVAEAGEAGLTPQVYYVEKKAVIRWGSVGWWPFVAEKPVAPNQCQVIGNCWENPELAPPSPYAQTNPAYRLRQGL